MITAKDISLLKKHFVTKEEFADKLVGLDSKLDRIQNTLDGFVGRVTALDEEQTMLAHQQSETRDRLTVVENKLGLAL